MELGTFKNPLICNALTGLIASTLAYGQEYRVAWYQSELV